MKTIGIVGSRRRNKEVDRLNLMELLLREDFLYNPDCRFVSGGCPKGGDRFAEEIAEQFEHDIIIHHPDWSKGRYAGLERNTLIARDSDVLIALVAPDRKGGTEDTIRKFHNLGKSALYILESTD